MVDMSKKSPKSNYQENAMVRALDHLAEFEAFQDEIAPALRGAVKAGKTPDEIFKLCLAHLAARQATIALTEKDPAKALAAIKDILDRTSGKATEKKEVKLSLENAPEEQLDAKLKTLLAESSFDEDTTH
jgi:hypothetical protein